MTVHRYVLQPKSFIFTVFFQAAGNIIIVGFQVYIQIDIVYTDNVLYMDFRHHDNNSFITKTRTFRSAYHIISYHIISYHIISYHIISYHIISYHIISYHIISYHIH